MRGILRSVLLIGLSSLGTGAMAQTDPEAAPPSDGETELQQVWCVGGPVGPSYAFTSRYAAQQCAQVVGSYSRDCRRAVRLGGCRVYSRWVINSVAPGYCQCAPARGRYIGEWW